MVSNDHNDIQDGTIGFGPQVAGQAKVHRSHTTSFGRGLPPENPPASPAPYEVIAGQEEGGRLRQPASSAAGRIVAQKSDDENAKDPAWKAPVDLPGVKPQDYDKSIPSGRGSAEDDKEEDADPARREQKRCKQLPLHDECIGGG